MLDSKLRTWVSDSGVRILRLAQRREAGITDDWSRHPQLNMVAPKPSTVNPEPYTLNRVAGRWKLHLAQHHCLRLFGSFTRLEHPKTGTPKRFLILGNPTCEGKLPP